MFSRFKHLLKKITPKINETDLSHKDVTGRILFSSEVFQMPQLYDIDGNIHKDICAYSVQVPPAELYSIKNGKCIVGYEEIYTSDNKVIKEITSQKSNPMIGRSSIPLMKAKYIKGIVLNLALSGLENNYYHFNVEFLARYYLYFVSKIKADYIIFPLNTKFQKEFADLLGINQSKILDKTKLPIIRTDILLSPCLINNWRFEYYLSQTHYLKEWVPSWLKDAYKLPKVNRSNRFGKIKNIYISRAKANGRKVINEHDILNLLKEYKFEVVLLEDLSVNDQIELFSGIDMVIAPHGAGLINISYCKNKIKILELYPEHYHDSSFRIQAVLFGHTYYYSICSSRSVEQIKVQSEDLIVNIDSIQRWLEKSV